MKCEEISLLVTGYLDGELDLVRSLEIEEHLAKCPGCAHVLAGHRGLQTALRDPGLYYHAPAYLRHRVLSSLPAANRGRTRFTRPTWRALAIAASLAFVALLAWDIVRALVSEPADHSPAVQMVSNDELRAQEVIAGHVRSLMANKPVDKDSSNEHTVKPWFNDKVVFSPLVKKLDRQRFFLIGGRLDYLDNQKAAAIVYRHAKHVINVFMVPAAAGQEQPLQAQSRQGFHLFHWTHGGLSFWVISDLNPQALGEFVRLLRS